MMIAITDFLAAISYAVLVVAGLLGLILPHLRPRCGLFLKIASFWIALDVWIWSARAVYQSWGIVVAIISLCLTPLITLPVALIATVIKGSWVIFGYLLSNTLIWFVCRLAAIKFSDWHDPTSQLQEPSV